MTTGPLTSRVRGIERHPREHGEPMAGRPCGLLLDVDPADLRARLEDGELLFVRARR